MLQLIYSTKNINSIYTSVVYSKYCIVRNNRSSNIALTMRYILLKI